MVEFSSTTVLRSKDCISGHYQHDTCMIKFHFVSLSIVQPKIQFF
jgi:hypothetical protein